MHETQRFSKNPPMQNMRRSTDTKGTKMKTLVTVWSVLWLLVGLPPQARSQSSEVSTSQSAAADSAAAKAAERKRRFEEEKQRIEGRERVQTPPCTEGKATLYITPAEAGMLIGESRGFTLFDTDGHNLTATAEWSVSSSYLATLTRADEPKVTAKNEGTFKVTATMDTRTAEATVKVYPGDKLPIGALRWKVDPIPCSKNSRISKVVQAMPH
jgi:hypothetical protein